MPPIIPSPDPIIPDIVNDLGFGEDQRSDYRPVPRSDQGNETYRERGMLGGYATNGGRPFENPPGVVMFAGYGGDHADLERGWCEPLITQDPAYDLANYKDRSSSPKVSDLGPGDVMMQRQDWEFRNRNRRSEGFLTRPRIPVERG